MPYVNSTYMASFGTSSNHLGMNSSSFDSCYNNNCAAPYGSCTTVNGSSAYDQFDIYRSQSFALAYSRAYNSTCSYVDNALLVINTTNLTNLFQRFTCSWPSTTILTYNVQLNATAYALVYGFPRSNVSSALFTRGDGGSAYSTVNLQNIGQVAGNFSLTATSCCLTNATGPFCQGAQTGAFTVAASARIVPASAYGLINMTIGKHLVHLSHL